MKMKKKITLVILVFSITLLTACGGLNAEQKEKWQETSSQIELQRNTLESNTQALKKYYESIEDEVKRRMEKIDFSSFAVSEEWKDIPVPEKKKDFEESYNTLQQRLSEINKLIDAVPSVESVKQQKEEIEKQIEEERLKAEEEKRLKAEQEEKKILAESKKSAAEKQSNTSNVDKNTQQTAETFAVRREYTHSALEGCVIVESDKTTGHYSYKTKCPNCGKVNNSVVRIYNAAGSGRNSSDVCRNSKCPDFGKSFSVKIKITSKTFKE